MNIIDLDLLVSEPIKFKIGGEIFEVPSSPSTQLVLQMVNIENKAKKTKNHDEQIYLLAEMVSLLLSQGERKVSVDEVIEKFSLTQMKRVIDNYQQKMREINNNPN
jgi:hypothetical protein